VDSVDGVDEVNGKQGEPISSSITVHSIHFVRQWSGMRGYV